MNLKDYIRSIPDYPKKGIQFKDITTLLANPTARTRAIQQLSILSKGADKIVGLDARGFIFGTPVAENLGISLVLARKPGKLPRETIRRKTNELIDDKLVIRTEKGLFVTQKYRINSYKKSVLFDEKLSNLNIK
mgnify:CR=1 FL=1